MDLSNFETNAAEFEFRSDTFTTPTVSMIRSLSSATVGDSVYDEDDSTNQLQKKMCELTGKPLALYCVSGTLSNQIAIRTNLFQPPYSILCDFRAHVYEDEAAGLACLSQAMSQPILPKNSHHLTLEDDILPHIIPDDGEIHAAPTKLICLENTLHGMIFPLDEIKKISAFCRANDIRLHLDGARLWDASVESGVSFKEYCSYFDSVSICLSKSIGAPIGSVLVGEEKFINKANHFKKQCGGGIRQSGILAVMAMTAIDENWPKLKNTHENAKIIGDFCKEKNIALEHPVETNFVFIDFKANKFNPEVFEASAKKHGVKVFPGRLAFHYQQSDESIERMKKVIMETWEHAKTNPYEPVKTAFGIDDSNRLYKMDKK